MNRPNPERLTDCELLALGVRNLCESLKDRENSGSVVAVDYLCRGMDAKISELVRTWEILRAGIYGG